jgi:hypothetical protein
MAKIFRAPCIFAAWITANPTAPKPQTATVDPGVTVVLLIAAPHPVLIPQPKTQTWFKSAALLIFAADIYEITVYSLNVEQPIKWKIGLPSFVVNLEVPSGIRPFPWVPRIFGHKFVL